jgi:conjugative transfer signal peptidase TraF
MTTTGQSSKRHVAWFSSVRVFALIALVFISSFQICDGVGLRINTSPSLPLGLYVTTKSAAAELVEFCPSEPFAALAATRGYRPAGSCPDGAAPLLKPVAARAGDRIELSEAGISVNARLLPRTAPLTRDTQGRPLRPWPLGSYRVDSGTVWVASTYNPRSFDSRYFGPIRSDSIRDRVRPLLTTR